MWGGGGGGGAGEGWHAATRRRPTAATTSLLSLLQLDGGRTYTEPAAIMTGAPEGGAAVPLRVHDACFTSEVLGSLKCDCADQLALALDAIQAGGVGIVVYLQQEGRGIGLANKIAAYALQDSAGLDTVDANRALGLPDDCREYSSVANILKDLGVSSVALMTNNPRKVDALVALGVDVVARVPCLVQAQAHSVDYLRTKGARMAHMMGDPAGVSGAGGGAAPLDPAAPPSPTSSADLDGSFCYWEHSGEPGPPAAAAAARRGSRGSVAPPASTRDRPGVPR